MSVTILQKRVTAVKDKEKLIVLIGPTAVGKTNLSIALAKAFNGEIISGDSMQIYKGLDIGTAKITPEEMSGIVHHLIDIKDPQEGFSAAEFQRIVRSKISDISSRGKLPIIAGGTGLYIQSAICDYQFSDEPGDPAFRETMEARAHAGFAGELYAELKSVDPESAEHIHPNNVRRVIRALEIYRCTGRPMSEYRKNQQQELLYNAAIIGLTMDRAKLYERINLRVDQMLEQGLLEEVKALHSRGIRDVQSVQAIGYKELYDYLDRRIPFPEAVEQLKQNSRRYAKRQLTWFRNKMPVNWFDMTDEREQAKKTKEIIDFIAGKLNLKSNTY